ncbi:MAG: tyrosine-type recombinase/integrase [Firmicutes bacterium]|nr:tyrosine-type recombinase/integrase [Clostridia bacterium]MBQ6088157.1 tyrosine-type recombinase/integrase [Bacillota bacterium]
METNKLQQLMNGTQDALAEANASGYFQKLFKTVSRQFIIYAEEHDIESFNMDTGLQFLDDHYSMSQKIAEKKWCSMYLRCINAISEYQMTGTVDMYLTTVRKEYIFPDPFKESAESYLAYREKIGIIPKSIQVSRLYLYRFFSFLEIKDIHSLAVISVPVVLDFLKSLSAFEKPTINTTMRAVRLYLKYCFENGFIQDNLFPKLPNPHYNRNSRLPSTYTAQEVRDTLSAIDTGNPCGIRDYAIILLLARLGLRSSDVANLRFSNIDWENDMIRLTQVKTGNPLELPLLSDVGEAIINYLKNARPKTDSDHVFVRMQPPYTGFNPGAVGALVHNHLVKAGIRLEGRKSGSHALRHSLAKRLLEHEIPLPVISEILGHTSTETTMTYLRVDINELKKCALEVVF